MRRVPMLMLTVLVGGFSSLAVEMAASRLLNNYFGSSQIVWAVLIGSILVYLTVGYYLGGRAADRNPRADGLYGLMAWAGLLVGLIPYMAQPILSVGQVALDRYVANLLAASVLGVLALFAAPVILLGCISPYATRLALRDEASAGNVAGRIYALSTVGSILGTFLPVLVLVPSIGTRTTFTVLSLAILLVALVGLASQRSLRPLFVVMPVLVLLLRLAIPGGPVKSVRGKIYERESPYNYIQVVQAGSARYLVLNEGQGIHSVYDPENPLTGSIWDLFLVAPYFNDPPFGADQVHSLCLIGLAAGTVAQQYAAVYPDVVIDGVEIDPDIIEVGREYFEMNAPNLNAIAQDGRYYLANTGKRYDVIAIDAYRPPYIPPHLTTVEFFQEARDHLTESGVVAINVGRSDTDFSLVNALATTMAQVFPSIYLLDLPTVEGGLSNTLVIGTAKPTAWENLPTNAAAFTDPWLQAVGEKAIAWGRDYYDETVVFTDDRAPVEQVVHALIIEYIGAASR